MLKFSFFLMILFLTSCSTTTYYIVRHAEKETGSATMMSSDVPLTSAGKERAVALKNSLMNHQVAYIFSTNYIRTKATAQPLSEATGITIEIYHPGDSLFIPRLKRISRGNVLVVGHSNTVDDLVNGLMNKLLLQDLQDTAYGDLFIVSRKGKRYTYQKLHFGR